jgi:dolichyl-phosphate beta-glucosyltransferase
MRGGGAPSGVTLTQVRGEMSQSSPAGAHQWVGRCTAAPPHAASAAAASAAAASAAAASAGFMAARWHVAGPHPQTRGARRIYGPGVISVVIPAYNEQDRLGATLARITAWLGERGETWEVIVVDDGSRDRTCEIAAEAGVRVIALPQNRGKGAAVRAGMLAANGERILFSDADLATPIEELDALAAELDRGADIAIASRAIAGAQVTTKQHPLREYMGRTFNVIVRVLRLGGIKDTQCGFKLFTRAAARDLFGRATIDGFAFDVEILWLARGRYRVAEVPVVWRHVEESKVSPGRDAMKMLLDVVKLRIQLWRHHR